jgi:hypothetical protein
LLGGYWRRCRRRHSSAIILAMNWHCVEGWRWGSDYRFPPFQSSMVIAMFPIFLFFLFYSVDRIAQM